MRSDPQENDFPGEGENFKPREIVENGNRKTVYPLPLMNYQQTFRGEERACVRGINSPPFPYTFPPAYRHYPLPAPCPQIGCLVLDRCASALGLQKKAPSLCRPVKMTGRLLKANRITQNLEAACSAPRSCRPSRTDPGPHDPQH